MRSFSECEPDSSLSVYVLQHLQPVAQTTTDGCCTETRIPHMGPAISGTHKTLPCKRLTSFCYFVLHTYSTAVYANNT